MTPGTLISFENLVVVLVVVVILYHHHQTDDSCDYVDDSWREEEQLGEHSRRLRVVPIA